MYYDKGLLYFKNKYFFLMQPARIGRNDQNFGPELRKRLLKSSNKFFSALKQRDFSSILVVLMKKKYY